MNVLPWLLNYPTWHPTHQVCLVLLAYLPIWQWIQAINIPAHHGSC